MKGRFDGKRPVWGFSEEGLERFRSLPLSQRIGFVEEIILLKHELGILERERENKSRWWMRNRSGD